jgi:CheY-like chemotaxis protein
VLLSTVEETPLRVAHDEPSGDVRGAGTVLVVDDEELIRNFVKRALEPFGYGVLLAQNGLEAMRSVKERPGEIGLVLLDVAMPGMDGLETLIRIREITPDVPVLVCSAFGDKEVEAHFAGQTISGFFPKPYTVKQLARKVKECIAPAAGKASA